MVARIQHIVENDIEKKHCGKCRIYKCLTEFGSDKKNWDTLRSTCKECLKQYNQENKERKTEYNKQYWQDTKEEQKVKQKKWREENPDRVKENMKKWLEENAEYKKEMDKKYRQEHIEQYRENHRIWTKKRYHELKTLQENAEKFAEHKIKYNTSRRIREILGQQKSERCMDYVGCSLEDFRIHLECQFKEGMEWDNYGETKEKSKKNVWHIDHIIPCVTFDFSKPEEQRKCFHYTNLQPLWWKDNISKNDFLEDGSRGRYKEKI